jgi:hypothetical protein
MQDPSDFVTALSKWMLPPRAVRGNDQGHVDEAVLELYSKTLPLEDLPDVLGMLGTMRKRFYALNYGTEAAGLLAGKASAPKRR